MKWCRKSLSSLLRSPSLWSCLCILSLMAFPVYQGVLWVQGYMAHRAEERLRAPEHFSELTRRISKLLDEPDEWTVRNEWNGVCTLRNVKFAGVHLAKTDPAVEVDGERVHRYMIGNAEFEFLIMKVRARLGDRVQAVYLKNEEHEIELRRQYVKELANKVR